GGAALVATGGGTLDNVTLAGKLKVDGVTIINGLTLSNGLVQVGDDPGGSGTVNFSGAQTLGGTGEVRLGIGVLNVFNSLIVDTGITVDGSNGLIQTGPGGLTNRGIIAPDAGGTFSITNGGNESNTWTNAPGGTLKADGADLFLGATWS